MLSEPVGHGHRSRAAPGVLDGAVRTGVVVVVVVGGGGGGDNAAAGTASPFFLLHWSSTQRKFHGEDATELL